MLSECKESLPNDVFVNDVPVTNLTYEFWLVAHYEPRDIAGRPIGLIGIGGVPSNGMIFGDGFC